MTNGSCFKWACLDAAWKNQLERKWQIDMQRIFKFYSYLPQNTFVQVRIKVSSFFLMCLFTLKFFRFRLRLSFISKLLWPNFANNSTPPRYSKNIRYSAIKNSTSLLNLADNLVFNSVFDSGSSNSGLIHQIYDSTSPQLRTQPCNTRLDDKSRVSPHFAEIWLWLTDGGMNHLQISNGKDLWVLISIFSQLRQNNCKLW